MRYGQPVATDLPTQHLFGLDFVTDCSIDDIVDVMIDACAVEDTAWRCVVTPNVDHLVRYDRFPSERAIAEHAWLVLPDGMPIVWTSRLLGRPLVERLTGADLFVALLPQLVETDTSTVVVASSEAVADRLPSSTFRCIVPAMFDVGDDAAISALLDQIDEQVEAAEARFLVIGVSMPKHHLIASQLEARWRNDRRRRPIVLLLGASPDFALGLISRAPPWMRRNGLEWLHRLILEPRRLARRYIIEDPFFVVLVWREWRNLRRGRSAGR